MDDNMITREEFFVRIRESRFAHFSVEHMYAAYEAYVTCPICHYHEVETGVYQGCTPCAQCGNCCRRDWRVELSFGDVLEWIGDRRTDLLASLDFAPGGGDYGFGYLDSTTAIHIADRLAESGEETVAQALSIAYNVAVQDGCYVLPKSGGCAYLGEGCPANCMIYEARPAVCRRFPGPC